jgi:uncharacterized protein YbjT (DUF2867 family)
LIAVIAGSTGLVGALLLSKLLKDKATTQVISVTRRPLGFEDPKLKEVIIPDFNNLVDHKDEIKGDIYFCALGTTIKAAGHKAQSFTLVSANMADANSSVFYNQVKGLTEQALMNMQFNRLIILRPGLLMGKRTKKRTGEEFAISIMNILSPILPSKIEKKLATNTETLTMRMLKEGQNPAAKIKIINAVDI